jgi:1L-myo-inositol 1-phosphate cytidylyltransferase
MKAPVSQAVILMAGCGSRLRGTDETFLKPLVPVLGHPVVSYTIEALTEAGIKKIIAIIGFEARRLGAALKKLIPGGIELRLVENLEWQKQNGISALAARGHVTAPFFLTMSDHVFERAIVDLLIERADRGVLNLAIDRKINSFFDLEDAMKVQTRDGRVVEIGKRLSNYDAIDTGAFVCPLNFFDYLERAKKNGDCSLADGVRLMSAEGNVCAIDIGGAWWQDVDTPEMLKHAEDLLRARSADRLAADASAPHCEDGKR